MSQQFDTLYQAVFLSCAVALVVLERIRALQCHPVQIARRWTSNIGLLLISSGIGAVVVPLGIYAYAEHQPPGLMSGLGLSFVVQVVLTFALLDLWKYWEHRLCHRMSLLWRLHLVHHSDTHVDVTTSERHHPLEVLTSTVVLLVMIAVLGLPAPAVGLYLLVATVIALCSHANVRLPTALDRVLRKVVVTPRLHAIHHSDRQAQTDSNYGSVLTTWDRLFGTYVDPEHTSIARFGLQYFHRARDTGLIGVLQQPFLYRRSFNDAGRDSERLEPPVAKRAAHSTRFMCDRNGKVAAIGAAIGCTLLAFAMWPAILGMAAQWGNGDAYQYGWLVAPMVVYLLGWHRHTPLAVRPEFSGVPVVIAGAFCWVVASLMNIDVGRQFAFVLSLQGIAMSTLGWRSYRQAFPTLALLFLMIPSGDLLEPVLRTLTLKSIELFAWLSNIPYSVDGFTIFVGTHRYIVVDECSGLAYVTLAAFFGYCVGLLLDRSFFTVLAMSLLGAALGLVSNVLRVNAIVLLDWTRNTQMSVTGHGMAQWIGLFVVLGIFLYVLERSKIVATPIPYIASGFDPSGSIRKFGPIVAALSGFVIAGASAAMQQTEQARPHGIDAERFAGNTLGWMRPDDSVRWSVDRQSLTQSIHLIYRRGAQDLEVVIVEALSPTAKLLEPRLAPEDEEVWREKQRLHEVGCAGLHCIALTHSILERSESRELRHVYFVYSIGTFATDSKFAFRAAHGWYRLTGDRATPRLIEFTSGNETADADALAAAFDTLQSQIVDSERGWRPL